jgi:limonene 1,2-monooxygenase
MSEIELRHGIFLPPFHPNEENPTQCLERDLDLIWTCPALVERH